MVYSTEWNLQPILGDSTPEEVIEVIKEKSADFEKHREKLGSLSKQDFNEIISHYKELKELSSCLSAFVRMQLDTDLQNSEKSSIYKKTRTALSECATRIQYFSIWWKNLDDKKAEEFMEELGEERYYFENLRTFRPHTLTEPEEKISTLKDATGSSAHVQMYDKIDASITYEWDGKEVSEDEIRNKFFSPDASTRRKAFETYYSCRKDKQDFLADLYQFVVLDWENERKIRNYPSAISIWNKWNDIPDEVVDAHLDACRDAKELWWRFFAIKGKILGEKITRFDIYAPIDSSDKKFEFTEAVELTFEALNNCSPNLMNAAKEIYSGEFVHARPIPKAKRGGAYCYGVTPKLPPYLMYNFTNSFRDVETVAHETGHGVHHQLARNRSVLTFGHALPIAETASVFAEMLITDMMLEKFLELKKSILGDKLSSMYSTIGRQSFFVMFEKKAHELIVSGASTEEISKAYHELLKEQFGDMEIPEIFSAEWMAIPHFIHTPFYCYAYSFGNLLTLALYEQYKKEGKSFVEKYEKFLAAGESMSPIDMTSKILGIDIRKKEFWEQGFKVVERMIDELESLVE